MYAKVFVRLLFSPRGWRMKFPQRSVLVFPRTILTLPVSEGVSRDSLQLRNDTFLLQWKDIFVRLSPKLSLHTAECRFMRNQQRGSFSLNQHHSSVLLMQTETERHHARRTRPEKKFSRLILIVIDVAKPYNCHVCMYIRPLVKRAREERWKNKWQSFISIFSRFPTVINSANDPIGRFRSVHIRHVYVRREREREIEREREREGGGKLHQRNIIGPGELTVDPGLWRSRELALWAAPSGMV